MAVGDVYSGLSSVVANGYLDIRPNAGVEAVIHNIYHESSVQIEFYNGTNSLIFEVVTDLGVYARFAFHVTNAIRIRVKNTATTTKLIGYDGIVTKG